jgi:hypothetical protein
LDYGRTSEAQKTSEVQEKKALQKTGIILYLNLTYASTCRPCLWLGTTTICELVPYQFKKCDLVSMAIHNQRQLRFSQLRMAFKKNWKQKHMQKTCKSKYNRRFRLTLTCNSWAQSCTS